MGSHECAISEAARRSDVYDLVRVACAYPDEASEIDTLLAHIIPRLGSER
jgi:hypothetical protein